MKTLPFRTERIDLNIYFKISLKKFTDAPSKLDQSFMGLRKVHSEFLFNEGFLIESRFWVGHSFNEGFFSLKLDKMGEALILKCPANERMITLAISLRS